jgi:GT2 family glycosyltransferase
MFEDDDYARRLRQAGFKIVCAEDVFVHHFGQASMGELCGSGDYDRVLENRRRFEEKWALLAVARRITPDTHAFAYESGDSGEAPAVRRDGYRRQQRR